MECVGWETLPLLTGGKLFEFLGQPVGCVCGGARDASLACV